MASFQARFFNFFVRALIRKKVWGKDAQQTARRARRLFGSPQIARALYVRGLNVRDFNENTIRGEWLETKERRAETIFYIHGGGFVSCSPQTHRPITAKLARLTDYRVFSLDYRLAPENPYPAAIDDVFAAYRYLIERKEISAEKTILAGDSAGGGLVLSLLLRLKHDSSWPLPAGAVCFSPWSDFTGTNESISVNADRDAMFYPENITEFARAYLAQNFPAKCREASPAFSNFANLPPILFQVGAEEVLLDDSGKIHEKIRAAGGTSELQIYKEVHHCWQMLAPFVPEANEALTNAAEFMRRCLSPKSEL